MNIRSHLSIFIISFIVILLSSAIPAGSVESNLIDKLKITDSDIPDGFVYGMIPNFAKKTLLANPWLMDKAAITRLTKNIYPKGDATAIKNMHMSILAKKERPYNDDIVCYIIVYKDARIGKKEMEKLSDFSKINSDRTIVLQRGTTAIFLIVDDVRNYKYISVLKEKMEERFDN
jgi:hypothetical protein